MLVPQGTPVLPGTPREWCSEIYGWAAHCAKRATCAEAQRFGVRWALPVEVRIFDRPSDQSLILCSTFNYYIHVLFLLLACFE